MVVDRDEFERWMEVLRGDIKGVHERLDAINGRVRNTEQDVAVLQDRGARDNGARWTTGITAAGVAVLELLHRIWGIR